MSLSKIKQTEAELKKITVLKYELEDYKDSSLKWILLKTCTFCETILKKELKQLQNTAVEIPPAPVKNPFEGMNRFELERIAFDFTIPDETARLALELLLKKP
jgi:hypothetical protein